MLFFEHPAYVGIGVFLSLTGIYWLWRWVRTDGGGSSEGGGG
jgi:hypothetical protein